MQSSYTKRNEVIERCYIAGRDKSVFQPSKLTIQIFYLHNNFNLRRGFIAVILKTDYD